MSQDPFDPALDELIETTIRQILAHCQPGVVSDPFVALRQLLFDFLQTAREIEHDNALRQ